jgi:hypothetical protein
VIDAFVEKGLPLKDRHIEIFGDFDCLFKISTGFYDTPDENKEFCVLTVRFEDDIPESFKLAAPVDRSFVFTLRLRQETLGKGEFRDVEMANDFIPDPTGAYIVLLALPHALDPLFQLAGKRERYAEVPLHAGDHPLDTAFFGDAQGSPAEYDRRLVILSGMVNRTQDPINVIPDVRHGVSAVFTLDFKGQVQRVINIAEVPEHGYPGYFQFDPFLYGGGAPAIPEHLQGPLGDLEGIVIFAQKNHGLDELIVVVRLYCFF